MLHINEIMDLLDRVYHHLHDALAADRSEGAARRVLDARFASLMDDVTELEINVGQLSEDMEHTLFGL